jgi:hypothetical protein
LHIHLAGPGTLIGSTYSTARGAGLKITILSSSSARMHNLLWSILDHVVAVGVANLVATVDFAVDIAKLTAKLTKPIWLCQLCHPLSRDIFPPENKQKVATCHQMSRFHHGATLLL